MGRAPRREVTAKMFGTFGRIGEPGESGNSFTRGLAGAATVAVLVTGAALVQATNTGAADITTGPERAVTETAPAPSSAPSGDSWGWD